MGCTAAVYDQFDKVPPDAWNQVVGDDGTLEMDLRLLGAFQRTMSSQCKCWAVLFHDPTGRPIAAAGLCLFNVDGMDSTSPVARKFSRAIRAVWPNCLRFNVLFCGLPVPSGASHLRIVDGVDAAVILPALDRVMRDLARQERARLLVLKEFDEAQLGQFSHLRSLGYIQGEIPAMHVLGGPFRDFDDYCGALKSRYRAQVKRSIRKFEQAGFEVEHVRGQYAREAYADELHALYRAVWERSRYRLEFMPAEFFRETARALGDRAALTLVRRDGRTGAFTFALSGANVYYNLYSGIDYDLNGEGDLYFNLFYNDLEKAFKSGAEEIHLGQTSDEFKARLGTRQDALYFYVTPVNSLLRRGLRAFAGWVFPPVDRAPDHDVFKSAQAAPTKRRGNAPVRSR